MMLRKEIAHHIILSHNYISITLQMYSFALKKYAQYTSNIYNTDLRRM